VVRGLVRKRRLTVCLLLATLAWVGLGHAQEAADTKPTESGEAHGRLVLVLPFENRTSDKSLDWMGAAFPDVLNRRLVSAGFLTIGRADRIYAYDHLGLPVDLEPTRATAIRIAQMLDADYVVFGHFAKGTDAASSELTAEASVLDVSGLHLNEAIQQQGEAEHLLQMINSLAWKVARQLDPSLGVDEQTFIAADSNLHTDAFREYIQGVVTGDAKTGVGYLRDAVKLDPGFAPAWLALGRAYFADGNYEDAATTLGHLPADDPDALEADFYRGLAFFYTGDYRDAEDAFAFVSTRLPLPEVVNNQGVAASRRGKDSGALFQQAIGADPHDPDYHFNLAVALAHRNDTAGALREINEVLTLRPGDTEAQSFANQMKNPAPPGANPDPGHAVADTQFPLTRIKRGYSEAGFRQAAFELEQLQQTRLASLPAAERAAELVKEGDQFFQRGLVLEAEREYREALKADAQCAPAHAGLAAVRERDGETEAARQEAHASIELAPSVEAWLVLARLDLQANQLSSAAGDVSQALRIDPESASAKGMKLALERRGQTLP